MAVIVYALVVRIFGSSRCALFVCEVGNLTGHHAVELTLTVNARVLVLVFARGGDETLADKCVSQIVEGVTLAKKLLDRACIVVVAGLDNAQKRAAELRACYELD